MELKELTEKVMSLFCISDIESLPTAIYQVCINNDFHYYERFSDLVLDLNTDWLQMIFQYYLADRKNNKQDYTPSSICRLLASVTETNGSIVYDLCAGSGALTIQKWAHEGQRKAYICEELDTRVIPLLLFNMAIRNMSGYVINRNALSLECYKVYRLEKGTRFSTITQIDTPPTFEADEIVSNPPYNIRWDAPEPLMADSRFFAKTIPPASNANYAFVLTALDRMREKGRCAFVLPCSVLSSDAEKETREYLIDHGLIERVVELPGKMFESTSIATCVIVFSFGNDSVKFFDLRKMAEEDKRHQRGQFGGASHENRTYVKIVNVLPDSVIESVSGECQGIESFSQEVSISDIKTNEYCLTPSRYIKCTEEVVSHRPFPDIMADINRVARERSLIKITCNETLAKQLGIFEAAQTSGEDVAEGINNTFNLLGGKYVGKRYIVLSKNKNEFKIENQDKEFLSSLVNIFLPMWKQHIFYLNQEENRLLAELRDAILPDLMSGKIAIDGTG